MGFVKDKIKAQNAKKTGDGSRARGGGAGPSINPNLVQKLTDLLTNDDMEAAAAVLRAGMRATKYAWDAKRGEMIDTGLPDHAIRQESALAIVAYKDGKPVDRVMSMSGSYRDLGAMLAKLKSNPEALRVFRSLPGVQLPDDIQETGGEKPAHVTRETSASE